MYGRAVPAGAADASMKRPHLSRRRDDGGPRRGGLAENSGRNVADMEAFEIPSGDFLWEADAATMSACATSFLNAGVWDGLSFVRAEQEVEWLD